MSENIAFVYHYWNIKDFMSYYGYKEDWNKKKYSPYDIFVEHPLGENSTKTHYCGSIRQKRWIEACKKGEIYGEIIAVFTGENAGILAHEYEHQMIITHKALYGPETLYNGNDGYAKFSTAGIKKSEETKKKISEANKGRIMSEEWKSKIGKANKGRIMSEEWKSKIGKANTGKKWSEEAIKKNSESHKGQIPWNKGKKSDKPAWNKGLPKELQPHFGKKHTKETKDKIIESNKRRGCSEKTKKILSEKAKQRWALKKANCA